MTDPRTITCNCAHIAPTMPTCRSEHLPGCPVAQVVAIAQLGDRMARLERALIWRHDRASEYVDELRRELATKDVDAVDEPRMPSQQPLQQEGEG